MSNSTLFKTGVIGTIVAVICCFTPVLVVLLSAAGLVAVTRYLDLVLFPAIAFFVGISVYALWKKRLT